MTAHTAERTQEYESAEPTRRIHEAVEPEDAQKRDGHGKDGRAGRFGHLHGPHAAAESVQLELQARRQSQRLVSISHGHDRTS